MLLLPTDFVTRFPITKFASNLLLSIYDKPIV